MLSVHALKSATGHQAPPSLLRYGDALLELEASTNGESQVTVLLVNLSPGRSDCLLFAGLADGSIAMHWQIKSSLHDDDWLTRAAASSHLLGIGYWSGRREITNIDDDYFIGGG
ncbi:hypothetical protein PR202_ga07150 [Eleusine coracana subsp. coracana]|uniref:Uncharacterized protein n=1 Tax=Eleusine coracana subsp. coracana TaxID=191504 RepID=A0AAV5BXY2_ELECO|nr:hypothetical protein PR202_ga07150 [Eleusine coracana subsp. coracana]